ncbi:MAG: threonine synthase [Thermovirgaceae bacterium]|nr:threonine synthase [Thermovirgaceae bacterium]
MAKPSILKCVLCGREFDPGSLVYTCPDCGLDGTLDVLYDYGEAKKRMNRRSLSEDKTNSLWRYREVLPVSNEENIPPLSVGWTPLYSSQTLAKRYGVGDLFVKDDGRNPTGSLKDRASAVGVAKALDFGQKTVACASTGNAASSLSGFAAVTGLKSFIFVPRSAPVAKVTQLLVYGSQVILVKGDYADAFNLATAAIEKWGWYNRNCAINPFLVEGKKTCAMEIAEQLNWNLPDFLFVSVGDGCVISGMYKGFSDLVELGITDHIPMIIGVQAVGASPVFDAIEKGMKRVKFGPAQTIADSISVGAPRNWAKALRAVRKSRGSMVTVTDNEILEAIPELARETGVFAEPAGAASFAGFKKAVGLGNIEAGARVALVVTGNGLKDISSAQKSVAKPLEVLPDIEELAALLKSKGSNNG